jgi:hypothetical protein
MGMWHSHNRCIWGLVRRHEGKIPHESVTCRLEDNTKTDPKEVRWERLDWIHLAQDRDYRSAVVSTVMNLRVPGSMGNFLTS